MREIEVDLIGDGTKDNPYRPDLPREYFRFIDDTRTFQSMDMKSKKVKVFFTKEIKDGELAGE